MADFGVFEAGPSAWVPWAKGAVALMLSRLMGRLQSLGKNSKSSFLPLVFGAVALDVRLFQRKTHC